MGPVEMAVVAVVLALERVVMVVKAAWLEGAQRAWRGKESLELAALTGRLVSHRPEFSPMRGVPWAQQALEAQALSAAAQLLAEAPKPPEERRLATEATALLELVQRQVFRHLKGFQ